MQLLTGPAPASTDRSDPRPAGDAAVPTPDIAALAARLDALSYDVEALKATVAELRAERLNDSSRAE
jgi:hypothetical protein